MVGDGLEPRDGDLHGRVGLGLAAERPQRRLIARRRCRETFAAALRDGYELPHGQWVRCRSCSIRHAYRGVYRGGLPVGRKHGCFVFHNTRHTAMTNLVNAGLPTHEAMAVSGNRSWSLFPPSFRYDARYNVGRPRLVQPPNAATS